MKRYHFLTKEEVYEAFNRLRDAFLAAKDGSDVEEIISAILTNDEKLRIGRRILIADFLRTGTTVKEIADLLQVGNNTVMSVAKSIDLHENGFKLLDKRKREVEKKYQSKKYKLVGGSTKIFKSKVYTGYKRKDVER